MIHWQFVQLNCLMSKAGKAHIVVKCKNAYRVNLAHSCSYLIIFIVASIMHDSNFSIFLIGFNATIGIHCDSMCSLIDCN